MLKQVLVAALVGGASAASFAQTTLISEGFENVAGLAASGWVLTNQSANAGLDWAAGSANILTAQAGSPASFISASWQSASSGAIANWLISPVFSTAQAGTVSFWASAEILAGFSDVLKYGLHSGAGVDTSTFTLTSTIDPVPGAWTQYSLSFAAQGAGSVARFAIQYAGDNLTANYVGIDSFTVTAVPEPATWMALVAGLAVVGGVARRRMA